MSRAGAARLALAAAVALGGLAVAPASEAKPARCATTDDGAYPCAFRFTGPGGSFEISAPGKPTFQLDIVEPGVAFGFVTLDGSTVALPGRFLRSTTDRACWVNDATETSICAW